MANATSIEDECIARLLEAFPVDDGWRFSNLYAICGYAIRVVGSSAEGVSLLTRALQHANIAKASVIDITIEIRSGKTNEIFQWMHAMFGERVIRIQNNHYYFLYNPGVNASLGTFSFFDIESGRAIYWIEELDMLPWHEIAAPFKTIFHWFFQQHDIELVHGAGIGTPTKGVLLIGKGGSGKSSTALTVFADMGLRYVGDDYVLLSMKPVPTMTSLYSSAKIAAQSLTRFDCFSNTSVRLPRDIEEKAVIFPCESGREVCIESLPISAIVLPVVSHSNHTTWELLHPAHALLALAPSTIFQLYPEDTLHDSFEALVRLVRQLPAYRILLGKDVLEVGQALELFCTTI